MRFSSGHYPILSINRFGRAGDQCLFNSSASQSFDDNGNTLTGSTGQTYTYNAWDEMVTATVGGTTSTYSYDALGRRITDITATDDTTTEALVQLYSASGQVIETDAATHTLGEPASSGSVVNQYVWGLRYVNDLVERDDNEFTSDGTLTLSRRNYALQDANFNVTAITSSSSGAVLEWFGYGAYGTRYVFDSGYASTTDGYNWEIGFQGGVTDPTTGLLQFETRDMDPVTGRWMEGEPFGSAYVDGANLYQFEDSDPGNSLDAYGFDRYFEPGSGAKEQPFKDPTVTLPNGSTGKISFKVGDATLYPDRPRHRPINNQVMLEMHLTNGKDGCKDCKWLQFFKIDAYDKTGDGQKSINNVYIKFDKDDYVPTGTDWTLDGDDHKGKSVFYSDSGLSNTDLDAEASIVDDPKIKTIQPGNPQGINVLVFSFMSILVCGGKPVYVISWTSTQTAQGTIWHTDVKMDPDNSGANIKLPTFASGDNLTDLAVVSPQAGAGYTLQNPNQAGGNTYPNPIDTKYRK